MKDSSVVKNEQRKYVRKDEEWQGDAKRAGYEKQTTYTNQIIGQLSIEKDGKKEREKGGRGGREETERNDSKRKERNKEFEGKGARANGKQEATQQHSMDGYRLPLEVLDLATWSVISVFLSSIAVPIPT